MTRKESTSPQADGCGLWTIIAIIVFLALISKCGSIENPSSQTSTARGEDGSSAETPIGWPAAEVATIRKAARQAERAVGALGVQGANTYSENCQAVLGRSFSIGVYDRCYAFELFAGRMLDEAGEIGFNSYVIDGRWSRDFGSASSAALSTRRSEIAETVRSIAVSPEAPPPLTIADDNDETTGEPLADTNEPALDDPLDDISEEIGEVKPSY